MEVGRLHRALIDIPASPCSRCTWGHTPTSGFTCILVPCAAAFCFAAGGQFSPLAPCFDAHSGFFIAAERKHKSLLISWRFSRGKGGKGGWWCCKRSSGIYFFRPDGFREPELLLKSKSRSSTRQHASVRWKRISTVIDFCFARTSPWHVNAHDRRTKKITFPLRQSNLFARYANVGFRPLYVCYFVCRSIYDSSPKRNKSKSKRYIDRVASSPLKWS